MTRLSRSAAALLFGILAGFGQASGQTAQATILPPPPPLTVDSSGALGEVALGSNFSPVVFSATGGFPPYTWSSTPLDGLMLNAQTGALTGTTAEPGNYTFEITATDSMGATAGLSANLAVLGIRTPSTLPGATATRPYTEVFSAAGGTGNYTFTASNPPPGLTFSGSTLSGTPSSSGSFTFQVQVSDGSGVTASSSFTIVVIPSVSITSSGNLGEIAFGSSAAAALAATGGKAPYTWSSANLPAGFTLTSAGAVRTVPSAPGNYSFDVEVSDSEIPPDTASLAVTLQVLGLTTASALPAASTMAPYSETFSAAGGTAPYTFSSSNLPAGLGFAGAVLGGTPNTVSVYSFTVQVADSTGFSTSSMFSLIVTGPPTPLVISGGALANGTTGASYSQALTGTGGAPPYNWTIIGGALPAGLSLNGAAGVISGATPSPGTSTFTAQATDSSGAFSSGVFTITIAPLPLTLTGIPFPNGIAGSDYPLQILAGSGGVGPYTFAIASGSLPPGLSLTNLQTGGQIGGVATTSGTYSVGITMTDSESPPLTLTSSAQIVITSSNPGLILSAGSLAFGLAAGAAGLPPPYSVTVESSAVSQSLSYSVTEMPPVSWLDVTGGGTTPGAVTVALDPSAANLSASSTPLTTEIEVTCLAPSPCAGLSQTIAVSLSVNAPPPLLTTATDLVQFTAATSATAALSQQVPIQNAGGGSAAIGSVSTGSAWLTVTGVPASVAAGVPAVLTFTGNPAGLGPGYFRTTVTIPSSGGTITVPVTLEIAQTPVLTLSAPGAQFQSTAGSAPGNLAGAFQIGVVGGGTVNWTATVESSASSWLRLNEGTVSGSASSSSPGTVDFFLEAGGLTTAQTYYGTIQVAAAGTSNSPLTYVVVLNVVPASVLPAPNLQPAGLVFQTVGGAGASQPQTVTILGNSANAVSYSASTSTTEGNVWLTVSPASGQTTNASSVSVNPGKLPPGVYTGTVSYQFPAAAVRSVNVTMIITPAVAACAPTQVTATQAGLANNFGQPVAWPVPLSVTVVDNCGAPVANAQVIETFSNGDPPVSLNLVSGDTGLYSGSWTPGSTSAHVAVTAIVTAPGLVSSTALITGEVFANPAPLLAPAGPVHIYNPLVGAALGQGTVLEIYGSNLSAAPVTANATPLMTTLGGTSVTIGGIAAPLYYVGTGQIDAMVPYELTPGNNYQVIVSSNGALSMPGFVQAAAATPGIAVLPGGQIIAQHPNYSLVSQTSPAAPGEYLVIYLSGMGQTTSKIADGAATPASPYSTPLASPTLTLNGVSIPIYFAGLAPGYVGLYQMNFQVPANTPNGDLQLVVSQDGTPSNSTVLPVHN